MGKTLTKKNGASAPLNSETVDQVADGLVDKIFGGSGERTAAEIIHDEFCPRGQREAASKRKTQSPGQDPPELLVTDRRGAIDRLLVGGMMQFDKIADRDLQEIVYERTVTHHYPHGLEQDPSEAVRWMVDNLNGWHASYGRDESLHGTAEGLLVKAGPRQGVIPWKTIAFAAYEKQQVRLKVFKPAKGKKGVSREEDQALGTSTPGGIQAHNPAGPVGKPAKRQAASPPPQSGAVQIRLDAIDPNPFQPRQEFDAAKLAELATSLKDNGQLQPVAMRSAAGGRYQILDGERRVRAARLAGWKTIRAEIGEATDEQMAKLALVANLDREALNPIERARQYQRFLTEFGWTQNRLAEEFPAAGSQGQISNTLRLLKLPAKWQQKIISQEIPPTHARDLVPYADNPLALELIDEQIKNDGLATAAQFADQIRDAMLNGGAAHIGRGDYSSKCGREIKHPPLTDELRREMDVIEVIGYGGKTVEVALNVAAYKKWFTGLEEAHLAKDRKSAKPAAAAKGADGKSKKLSAAEIKSQAEADKRRAAEQAKVFAKRLRLWRTNWLRYLCANEILAEQNEWAALKLLLWAAVDRTYDFELPAGNERNVVLLLAAKGCGATGKTDWERLSAADGDKLPAIASRMASGLFFNLEAKLPERHVPAKLVESIAADLEVDLAAAWRHELAGPLTEGYFNLHTKEQLVELGGELNVFLGDASSKSVMVKRLMGAIETKQTLPAEIGGKKSNHKAASAARAKRKAK